jgi:hypothetical protein
MKLKYKAFVMNVAKIWATDKMVATKRGSISPTDLHVIIIVASFTHK